MPAIHKSEAEVYRIPIQEEINDFKLAVHVQDGHFAYGSGKGACQALNGANLSVPNGLIYGLLGPSGCGKTTLLNVVIGQLKLKSGTVNVFGQKPGGKNSIVPGRGVGYMPQDLCLYAELNIKETLYYFGRIQNMDMKAIKERTEFLVKIFDLPTNNNLIGSMSGGQKRRVSLAVALIHKPPLAILDEPTVGVDPLLRKSIWKYLNGLTKEGISVIVTTHYIEEAGQADIVGLMRDGRLLSESSPAKLKEYLNEPTLEKCFLKICKQNECYAELNVEDFIRNSIGSPLAAETNYEKAQLSHGSSAAASTLDLIKKSSSELRLSESLNTKMGIERAGITNAFSNNFRKIATLFMKNNLRLKRLYILIIFQLVCPPMLGIIMCSCIGSKLTSMSMAVVNEEVPLTYSRTYLNLIDNNTIIQKPYGNLEDGINSVKRGDTYGVIHISNGFTLSLLKRFRGGSNVANETLRNSSIVVRLDTTNQQVSLVIQACLHKAFQDFSRGALEATGANTLLVELPVVFEDPVYGDIDISFTEYILPGVILNVTFFFALALTALTVVEERKSGLFDRSLVSGVRPQQIIFSQILTQSVILIFQIAATVFCVFAFFDVWPKGSFVWILLLTLLQGVFGLSLGLFISTLATDENMAMILILASYYPSVMISGLLWPLEGQPWFLRYFISIWQPQTIPASSLRAVLSKGLGIDYFIVSSGILVTVAWIAATLIGAILILKFKR